MKKVLFILALLPFIVKAQTINNQKVRWMQPIYMGSNTAASVNSSSDTGAFFFDRADSVLYFKYKGAARAIGYAGSIPNVGQQITDSLKALVRLRASGSGGIQLQNSVGTNVADFGIANTTNGSIAGGWNVGGNSTISGTLGVTQKATFSDSIVGVNMRLTGSAIVANRLGIGTTNPVVTAMFSNAGASGMELSAGSSSASGGTLIEHYNRVSGLYVQNRNIGADFIFDVGTSGTSRALTLNSNGSTTIHGRVVDTAQGNFITIGVDSTSGFSSYTLVLADAGYLKRFSNASAITITVPTNASVAFPIGTTIYFSQQGAGKVSVSPATSDVTIQSEGNLLGTSGQHAVIGLIKVNTNRWLLVGNRG